MRARLMCWVLTVRALPQELNISLVKHWLRNWEFNSNTECFKYWKFNSNTKYSSAERLTEILNVSTTCFKYWVSNSIPNVPSNDGLTQMLNVSSTGRLTQELNVSSTDGLGQVLTPTLRLAQESTQKWRSQVQSTYSSINHLKCSALTPTLRVQVQYNKSQLQSTQWGIKDLKCSALTQTLRVHFKY